MNGPSIHLSWAELQCHDGTPYPYEWRNDRAVELSIAFERIRELCALPLIVDSGYRTPEYNRSIGGAEHSQHCEGKALDLRPVEHQHLQRVQRAAVQARNEGLLRGIGFYNGFVHVDTREHPATWYEERTSN